MRLTFRCLLFTMSYLASASSLHAEAAIYFSQNRNGGWSVGWAFNEASGIAAARKAEDTCISNGGTNCLPIDQVFSNVCVALAIQVGSNGWAARYNPELSAARKQAVSGCYRMGRKCEVQLAFCDVVKERVVICTKPIFKEEHRLRETLDGTPSRTNQVAEVIEYLRGKYCRSIEAETFSSEISGETKAEAINEVCEQLSGQFRGETVHWSACRGE